jgi:hypothetical protein
MLVSTAKVRDLFLPHLASNHLFYKLSDCLACWRDTALGKAINLMNNATVLLIGKVLVELRLEFRSRGGYELIYLACHINVV